ncbi:MAG: type IV pilus biogenesis/stability protein PilW [Halioglobus sp.]|nr:type IV pilus biogenesis/stability protein PilW [Halioglobus sp.]
MLSKITVRLKSWLLYLAVLLVCVVSVGCISTTEGGFSEDPSPQKALETRVSLARQYIGEGNWAAAKRNLELAMKIDDDNAEIYEAFALVYQSTGEYELAEQNFKKSIRLNGKCSRCRNNYAAFLYSQERYEEAEKQLDYVIQDTLYSGRPNAFVNLGLCRIKLFDMQGAEEAFVRALAMDRTNQIALLEVAQLRFDARDYPTANKYYGVYRSVVRQQSARGLLLGIRLAQAGANQDLESSYALLLSRRFPDSIEYEAYRRTK